MSNITFVSLNALAESGTSLYENLADPAPSVEEQVHAAIRHDAVCEIVAGMAAADPILGEVLVRRLGLGGWPVETSVAIARSIEETGPATSRLFDRALTEFRLRAQFHPRLAYLQTAA